MSKLQLPYHVRRKSFGYDIYKWDKDRRFASRADTFSFYEDAKKEAYRLNGLWMAEQKLSTHK